MIVSPKKETAQVKVEDTQTVDTKAAETKIADNKTPEKQSPKKPSRQPKRWAIGLVAAGFMRVSVLILCRYQLRTARCDRSDGIASPQSPSDGRSPAARSAFVAGKERAPRSQK